MQYFILYLNSFVFFSKINLISSTSQLLVIFLLLQSKNRGKCFCFSVVTSKMSADKICLDKEEDDEAKNLAPEIGLQVDGSILAAEDDFCYKFMQR